MGRVRVGRLAKVTTPGALDVGAIALIHWQAMKPMLKGLKYHERATP